MPQPLSHLHGLQHPNATRHVTCTGQHNTTCSFHGVRSPVHHPQPTVRRANRFGLHACNQTSCLRACTLTRHHIKCFAAHMAPARAAASAEAQPVVDSDLEEFVNLAKELAQAAGSITRQYFRQPLTIDNKADKSPVTEADRKAERAMRDLISAKFPDHGIFGEEEGMQQPKSSDTQYLWVLDPIDGTKSFITGKPVFGTLIALLRNGEPIIGVIDQPITKERWVGVKDHGTTLNEQKVHTRECQDISLAYLYATTPHMFSAEDHTEQAFNNVRDAVRTPLYGCDCYAYGLLAAGCVDLVVEADLKPYDYMALVPIVQEAGGIMTDWLGNSLIWRCAPDGHLMGSLPGEVVAAGSKGIHEHALKLLDWERLQEQETPAYGSGASS